MLFAVDIKPIKNSRIFFYKRHQKTRFNDKFQMKHAKNKQFYCVSTNIFIENRLIFSISPSHCRLLHQKSIRNSIYYQNKSMSNCCRALSSSCSAQESYLFVLIFTAYNKDIRHGAFINIDLYLCIQNFKQTTFLSKHSILGIEFELFQNESYANSIDLCHVTAIHKQDFIIFILGTIRYAINKFKILIP